MMLYIDVMQDASEIIHYDAPGIPLYIRNTDLSNYPDKRALCHWHEDIEFIRIVQGCMQYSINGHSILLKENDCLMVNARQMHAGYSFQQQDCNFTCVLFHTKLLTGNQPLYQKYISPVLENNDLEYLHFVAGTPCNLMLTEALDNILALKTSDAAAYELNVISILNEIWKNLLQQCDMLPSGDSRKDSSELILQKMMVTYIYHHYGEKISLSDIAASGNVCRSKCCQIFKHYLQQSPIDFLNQYRLEVSCHLLKNTDLSITEIALSCGFLHLSYYSKMFCASYGYTPSQYRAVYHTK